MKIVHITSKAKGGAGVAAFRLFEALQNFGDVQVAFVAIDKTIDFDGNVIKDSFFTYNKPTLLKRLILKFEHIFFYKKSVAFRKKLNKILPQLNCEIATLPFSHFKVENHPLVNEADVIHLHWVGDLIDYKHFFTTVNKNIIWTCHDMNPFLGLFHYENDHKKNYDLVRKLDEEIINFKKIYIRKSKLINFIFPSIWLLNKTKEYFDINGIPAVNISYAIDLNIFKIHDKIKLRKQFNIETTNTVLLFVADNIDSYRKGVDLLFEALNLIDSHVTLITVGSGNVPNFENHHIVNFGRIENQNTMAEVYNLADAFVMPSREDNLPNVMLESLACGVPVVSFANSGAEDFVTDNKTGVLIHEISANALKDGIETFIKNSHNYDSRYISKFAEKHFNPDLVVKKHIDIYKTLF